MLTVQKNNNEISECKGQARADWAKQKYGETVCVLRRKEPRVSQMPLSPYSGLYEIIDNRRDI